MTANCHKCHRCTDRPGSTRRSADSLVCCIADCQSARLILLSSIANLKSKIENSPPTRRPIPGVRTVLGRRNVARPESPGHFTNLPARRYSCLHRADSLPSGLSTILFSVALLAKEKALAAVEALLAKEGVTAVLRPDEIQTGNVCENLRSPIPHSQT